ncbi:MAG: hypothetical protein HY723_03060, partial [Chloroflexi bacterium]|nr:hypothetical protein [Chloroflexota bacterium]
MADVLSLPEEELFRRPARARAAREDTMPKAKGKGPINVAIIGVGNCASSLVQG